MIKKEEEEKKKETFKINITLTIWWIIAQFSPIKCAVTENVKYGDTLIYPYRMLALEQKTIKSTPVTWSWMKVLQVLLPYLGFIKRCKIRRNFVIYAEVCYMFVFFTTCRAPVVSICSKITLAFMFLTYLLV